MGTFELAMILCFLAGAAHVLAPDHWMPGSVVAWQRGWGLVKTSMFSMMVLLVHILFGFILYIALSPLLSGLNKEYLFSLGALMVIGGLLLRSLRFKRIAEVLRAGPVSQWALFAVVSLLGPAEVLTPILLKMKWLGFGYLLPGVFFTLGSTIAGLTLILAGRLMWNRPTFLPRGIHWAQSRTAVLPALAVVVFGLSIIVKI